MAEKKKKFYRLRSNSLHTFNVKAWSSSAVSDWSADIPILTSDILPIAWPRTAEIKAKPLFFTRCIRVTWTPLLGYPLRFSHYVLFRKDTTEGIVAPTSEELAASGQAIIDGTLEDNEHFVKETGKLSLYVDRVKFDSDDDTDNGVLEEHQYHYWVWGVDNNGQLSYMSGLGKGYLGPDNAEFGKPNQPLIVPAWMTTEVHERNAWWCDVNVVWYCIDGAEGYWVQRKLKTRALWGLPVWVEHDPDGSYGGDLQQVTLNNFLCNTDYEFRVKAVNVPVRLVSDISEVGSYTTDKDPYPPDEIEDVDAKRLRQNLITRGEYIKLTWSWPEAAIMQQQIDYYRIYKYEGTDAAAITYLAYINLAQDSPLKAPPYTETKKFGGTHFVDDDIEELVAGKAAGSQSFFWNGEYGSHTPNDLLTAYIDTDLNTEVGTLVTNAFVNSAYAYDGTYSLDCYQQSSRLRWANHDLDGDEGYLSLRYYPVDNVHTQTTCRIFAATEGVNQNGVVIELRSGKLWLQHRGAGTFKETEHTKTWDSSDKGSWHHIEARWKKEDDILDVKVDDGDWVSSIDADALTSFDATVADIGMGPSGLQPSTSTRQRYDRLIVSPDFDYPEIPDIYYHYWVTAVDIDNQESAATMVESYDKVSFGPPDAPVLVTPLVNTDPGFNMVLKLGWSLFTVRMIWKEVDEATYYQVKVRLQLPNRSNPGPWMYSARIPQARIDTTEGNNPFFVYPFPLRGDTELEWAVRAGNLAGWSESDPVGPMTILYDTTKPSKPATPTGRCYGINRLFGDPLWMSVVLKWTPNANYEGIDCYQVFEDEVLVGTQPHMELRAATNIKQVYTHFGAAAGASHQYRVTAMGKDKVPGPPSDNVTINFQEWWKM